MTKTRAERERELRAIMQSDSSGLVTLYKQAADIPAGQVPTPGILMSQMIETILNKEYGPQA